MTTDELLEEVKDKESFIAYVRALAAERQEAERIERQNPKTYLIDGALGWKNGDIASFLYACLVYFEPHLYVTLEHSPSWKMFAIFLSHGKSIE